MFRNISPAKLLLVALLPAIPGCSTVTTGPSDDLVKNQVTDYVKTEDRFSEYFYPPTVAVRDRLVKEKEGVAVILCDVTVKAKKAFDPGEFPFYNTPGVAPDQNRVTPGTSKTVLKKFQFEKTDKGWKLVTQAR